MPRNIYLVRYSGFPFKDHWAILIPSATISTFGTLIQVEGNPRYGFVHSVVRNYDLSNETRSTKVTLLGEVEEKYMHDTPSAGTLIESDETNPRDEIERVALSVAAPGKSMRAVSGDTVRTTLISYDRASR